MNRNKLKTYAPAARRDFIQAMTDRAAFYGLTAKHVEPAVVRGEVAVIAGRDYPRVIADKRKKLEARVARDGFEQTMEAMAYTWFNRLVAIRFMELHGYLDHGYRVLSHPEDKSTPEILEQAEHVKLPGLKKDQVIDLKLEGNKDSELYRLLLTAQCNALHKAMPFLFERIDDETELLLPDNLLHSDSLVRKLINGIDEDDWKEVEIIGWLYQFYISERKDEVIGKVVASADIPAATQLFTPNWIVKYLVQNTLGRQWLATYPNSALRAQMEYYIEPAGQTSEVSDQIKAITPASLDPESLTMLDPACGSCHILVEGYDLFKAIYLERGYRPKEIPALILQKNLFGLEIDDRAAQLGAFALMMKARADYHRIFDTEAKPNVSSFQESNGVDAGAIVDALNSPIQKGSLPRNYLFEEIDEAETPLLTRKVQAERERISKGDIASLLALFENAKTFGSLIKIPEVLAAKLPAIEERLQEVVNYGDLVQSSAQVIQPIVRQARLLAGQYDAVVANPPYMGSKYYTPILKSFVGAEYQNSKADLYACFIERNIAATKQNGFVGMITIPNWMFLSSFEDARRSLLQDQTIDSLVHNGRGVFGSDFGSCTFVVRQNHIPAYRGTFRKLFKKQGSVAGNDELIERFLVAKNYTPLNTDFAKIPGAPLAYWVTDAVRDMYESGSLLSRYARLCKGMDTGDNGRFLRFWHEVNREQLSDSGLTKETKWVPYNKGGDYRRWYGNRTHVINWKNNGAEIKKQTGNLKKKANLRNQSFYFREGFSWTTVSMAGFSARYAPAGSLFDNGGCTLFSDILNVCGGLLNSVIADECFFYLAPTLNFQPGDVGKLPFLPSITATTVPENVEQLIEISRQDWNSCEISWEFAEFVSSENRTSTIEGSLQVLNEEREARFRDMKHLEEENNRILIEAYGLQEELSPEVEDDRITLNRANREEDIKSLISYAVGCGFGRYGLDEPGLIYAKSSNDGFEPGRFKSFRPVTDGIIPLLEIDWGMHDDAVGRVVEFIAVAWPKEHLEENIKFVADSLGVVNGEEPRDTIRRYLAGEFFGHHLSAYKKRPIYWLFSSGREHAFQCLVYLHRYNESTLARMRTEYVIPLQGQMTARVEQLEADKTKAPGTSQRKKLQKELDDLKKKKAELLIFEEKLKHFADQKIGLDLDDGVKVNYGKFGDLLADVKAIAGGKDDE